MARNKKGWKTALVVGLSLLTVAGAAAAAFTLFEPSTTKKLGRTAWSVGAINSDGAVSSAAKTSIVSDAFGCDGLKVDVAEDEFKGTYSVYFYTLGGKYLNVADGLTADEDFESLNDYGVPLAATCRIVYKPTLEEGDKIYFWEVGGFADDMIVTYNREQDSVLESSTMDIAGVKGTVYSMTEYDGALYAGIGGSHLVTSINGSDWTKIPNVPCSGGQIRQLIEFEGLLYGLSTASNSGVFAYDKSVEGENKFVYYEGKYNDSEKVVGTYFSLHSSNIRNIAVLNGKLFAFGSSGIASGGAMEDNEYKRVDVGESNVYVMTDPGCWVALPSPGDAVAFRDAIYVDGTYIFVGADGAVFTTTDLSTWYDYSDEEYGHIISIYHDGQNFIFGGEGGKLYVGTTIDSMHKAYNNSTMVAEFVRMIEGYDGAVYACAYSASGENGELWKSEDHGATWRVIVDGMEGLYTLVVMRNTLYVGAKGATIYYLGDI